MALHRAKFKGGLLHHWEQCSYKFYHVEGKKGADRFDFLM